MKPYKLGKGSGRSWRKVGLFFAVILVILGFAGYFGVRNIYERNLQPVNLASTSDVVYTLKPGSTTSQIGQELEDLQLIRSSRVFTQYVRSNELAESFIAGTYKLRQSMSVQEIVAVLTEGKIAEDLFTILPGSTLENIKRAFINEGFTEEEVEKALSTALYKNHKALVDKPDSANLEGYIYPDSYQLIKGQTDVQTVIRLALNEMAEALNPDIRAGISAQGLSVYDGIKLASIVEKEVSANNPSDRPQVAQVFLKRLKIGMPLQSNATDGWPSNYDTYKIEGLPPTPISNVTKSSLEAVVSPANTDYLYFVSGKDCKTRFSKTVEEHEVLIAKHGVARPEDNCR